MSAHEMSRVKFGWLCVTYIVDNEVGEARHRRVFCLFELHVGDCKMILTVYIPLR